VHRELAIDQFGQVSLEPVNPRARWNRWLWTTALSSQLLRDQMLFLADCDCRRSGLPGWAAGPLVFALTTPACDPPQIAIVEIVTMNLMPFSADTGELCRDSSSLRTAICVSLTGRRTIRRATASADRRYAGTVAWSLLQDAGSC